MTLGFRNKDALRQYPQGRLLLLPLLAFFLTRTVVFAQQHPNGRGGRYGRQEAMVVNVDGGFSNDDDAAAVLRKGYGDVVATDGNVYDDLYNNNNNNDNNDYRDPQLRYMAEYDFWAYTRADISSLYREPVGSRIETKPSFPGQAGKFINLSPEPLDLAWQQGPSGPFVFNDRIGPWQAGGTATFPGHVFVFLTPGGLQASDVQCRITVVPDVAVYYCDPFAIDVSVRHPDTDPRAAGEWLAEPRDLRELNDEELQHYHTHATNLRFAAAYKNFTGGSEWLSMYPREPPRHYQWRADYLGQTHHVVSQHTHFHTIPTSTTSDKILSQLSVSDMRQLTRHEEQEQQHQDSIQDMDCNHTTTVSSTTTSIVSAVLPLAEYRDTVPLNITLTAVSVAPRVLAMEHFLSDAEADHIMNLVLSQQHKLSRSTTNGHLSETRTSTTTWVPRHSDIIVDTIFRRVANVLQIDESLLRHRGPDEAVVTNGNVSTHRAINEDLQIVHYNPGQQYTAHHDFGYPKGHVNSPSRSINFCMYLNNVEEGGETAFPRWRNAETTEALKMKPAKGKAMIFYMVNPDGNLDDMTHHAALPVVKGEKFFANLWIHDPIRL